MAIPKLDRMAAAIDIVEGWIDPPEGLASDIEVLRATLRYAEIVAGGGSRVEMPMGPLIRMLQRAASPAQRRAASAVLGIFEHGQMTDTQSQPSLRTADARLRDSGDADLVLMADLNRALTAVLRRGPEATRPDWVALRDAVDAAPPSLFIEHWIRPLVVGMLRELDGDVLPADVPLPPPLPGMDPQLRLLAEQFMLSVRLIGVERRGSLSEIRRLAGEWEALSQRIEPDQLPARFGAAASSGGVQLLIARLDPSDRQAAETAVRQYREAVELAAGEHHPLWAQLAMPLAESLRLAGQDRAESLRLGLSALAAAARTVMLQNDIGDALALATDDRDRADQVLAWALADGDLATAVTALDASRGLVLAATSASRGVAERLAAAGHQDLAAEWRLTGGLGRDELSGLPLGALRVEDGTLPDALRAKVLAALDASPDGSATATVDQIQVALAATAADALVYLLAPSKRNPGMAVVVPRTGPPSIVDLPELHLDPAMPVGRYVASATRDLQAPISNRPVTLAGVAEWAGRAVLADLLPRLPAADGPPHVVLVPVGELALVPWHLGRTPGKRYAAEELVISYSPSARLFCDAARRPAVPVRSALIVGDPDGSLRFAGHEAQAIHRVFYPAGQFLGHSDGTREAVLNWIGRAGAGPLLLHFSCHGLVDTARPDQAALVLSRGQLSVRDLVDATRSAELVADQVFLAACHTNAITGTYDEAFSLASVFLATGATTVFGSLWAVPDEATSLLMFMLHHFLSAEGLPPARALHAAQLWMLNPDRQPPSTMPAELARYASRPDLADPIAWAAFTHLGR